MHPRGVEPHAADVGAEPGSTSSTGMLNTTSSPEGLRPANGSGTVHSVGNHSAPKKWSITFWASITPLTPNGTPSGSSSGAAKGRDDRRPLQHGKVSVGKQRPGSVALQRRPRCRRRLDDQRRLVRHVGE